MRERNGLAAAQNNTCTLFLRTHEKDGVRWANTDIGDIPASRLPHSEKSLDRLSRLRHNPTVASVSAPIPAFNWKGNPVMSGLSLIRTLICVSSRPVPLTVVLFLTSGPRDRSANADRHSPCEVPGFFVSGLRDQTPFASSTGTCRCRDRYLPDATKCPMY